MRMFYVYFGIVVSCFKGGSQLINGPFTSRVCAVAERWLCREISSQKCFFSIWCMIHFVSLCDLAMQKCAGIL